VPVIVLIAVRMLPRVPVVRSIEAPVAENVVPAPELKLMVWPLTTRSSLVANGVPRRADATPPSGVPVLAGLPEPLVRVVLVNVPFA
jgi:hypothetical protein